MNKILAIIRKDLLLRFESPSELLFFIILPLVFTFLLAGGTPSGDEDARLSLTVVDQARTPLSAQLLQTLAASTSVRPEELELAEAEKRFDERLIVVLLVIPPGFDQQAVEQGQAQVELRQQPNNLNAQAAGRAVLAAVQRVGAAVGAAQNAVKEAERIRPFADDAARQAYFEQALALAQDEMAEAPQRFEARRAATPDQIEYDPAANSSAGQLITWVFIPLIGISALYAYERSQGTLRRLLTTPTSKAVFQLGTIAGQVLTALFQMALLVGFGALVLKVGWARDLPALALLLTAAALAAAALGSALGTFVKTDGQANGLSIMLGMMMALLGGCWYPLELFPEAVRAIVKVLPTTWAMQGLLDLVLRGGGLADILLETGVLLGFAAVFFTVGVLRFKYE